MFIEDSCDRGRVADWWTKWPTANIGIVCGEPSGIVVVDVDGSEGHDSLRLAIPAGSMCHTVTARTPRGTHIYFKHPGFKVGNRASLLPGIDIRGDGGYVIAPPSEVGGIVYEWLNDPFSVNIAETPDWLLSLVTSK